MNTLITFAIIVWFSANAKKDEILMYGEHGFYIAKKDDVKNSNDKFL